MIGLRLVVFGMEIQRSRRQRVRVGAVVDIVVESENRLLAFIGNSDARVMRKRHGKEAVQRIVVSNRKHLRLPGVVFAKSKAEKVTNRRLDAWIRLSIPIHTQNDALEVIRLVVRNRE